MNRQGSPTAGQYPLLGRTPVSSRTFRFVPPTVLAPMHGVGGPETRAVIASYGPIGLVSVPFVRITQHRPRAAELERQIVRVPGSALSVQLMGDHADHLAAAAYTLAAAGVDVVDFNLGCPTRGVVRKGVGAALLNQPERVEELVARMRERTSCLLSVKLRAGYYARNQALEIAARAEAGGADFVIVHPRSRADGYSGVADWRVVAELKHDLRIPVIGNGDCWYAEDAIRLMRETGCDGVMIGRAALRNPWIFRQVSELHRGNYAPWSPAGSDMMAHLERLAIALESPGRAPLSPALGCFKEHVRWLLRTIPNGSRHISRVLSRESSKEMLRLLGELFALRSAAELDLDSRGSLGLEPSAVVTT